MYFCHQQRAGMYLRNRKKITTTKKKKLSKIINKANAAQLNQKNKNKNRSLINMISTMKYTSFNPIWIV